MHAGVACQRPPASGADDQQPCRVVVFWCSGLQGCTTGRSAIRTGARALACSHCVCSAGRRRLQLERHLWCTLWCTTEEQSRLTRNVAWTLMPRAVVCPDSHPGTGSRQMSRSACPPLPRMHVPARVGVADPESRTLAVAAAGVGLRPPPCRPGSRSHKLRLACVAAISVADDG